ncbi:MAG: roadblock/LC7 domain-containing protein [Candidatus Heimdallarchaeota archaeon]|nr:roadblock/LC7 domain-containing protein [Candidatus Heimdallarchaeota archaeon]
MSVDITQKQKQELVKLLTEISKQSELEALGIVTREGTPLAFFVQRGDPDLLSAISAAVISTGNMVTNKMHHGGLEVMLVRGDTGFTILSTAGDYILIGSSKEIHSIGITLNTIRDYAEPLHSILG